MPEFHGQQIGQFRIIRQVGRGGMGTVYEAVESPIGRRVALKVLPAAVSVEPDLEKRFEREIRATGKLNHPNIVQIYSVGKWEDRPYYAMEFIDGVSMDRFIRLVRSGSTTQFGDPPIAEEQKNMVEGILRHETIILGTAGNGRAEGGRSGLVPDGGPDARDWVMPREPGYFRFVARLVRDTAEALDHAHRQGVVHRDIKPANLMVTTDGQIHVTDFGLAIETTDATVTQPGTAVGTPMYMSPEQLLIRRVRVDQRTDIYSLGVTLYELLTLLPAFEGKTHEQLLLKIAVQDPRRPVRINPYLPVDLETIALKSMEKDPERRYQSAQLMADDLTRFLEDKPIVAAPASLSTKVLKFIRRHKALSAALAASLIFVIVGAATAWEVQKRRHEANRQAQIRSLVGEGEKAEEQQRPLDALNSYEAALALDKQNALLAAKVSGIREDHRALEQARERRKNEQLAARKAREAQAVLKDRQAALRLAEGLRPRIEQTQRDRDGILPVADRDWTPAELEQRLVELQGELAQAQREASLTFANAAGLLHGALSRAPRCKAVRGELAKLYVDALLEAERRGDRALVQVYERLGSLYDDGQFASILRGEGKLTIGTDPQGATVTLTKYVAEGLRLVPQRERLLGITPTDPVRIPMGSYLLSIEKEGLRTVKCPVLVTRQSEETLEVPLYTEDEIGEELVYVPPGKSIVGADPEAEWPLPTQPQTVAGFFIGKTEVTCGQYLEFLDALSESDPKLAKRRVPEASIHRQGRATPWPMEGTRYRCPYPPNFPTFGVGIEDAQAYCRWLSELTGRAFRLPTSLEWERAARGADGRYFPWGNYHSRGYANLVYPGKRSQLAPCGSHAFDVSPFGVYDLLGSVRELCSDVVHVDGRRSLRGQAWYVTPRHARLASRMGTAVRSRHRSTGFRVVCDPPR